MRRTPIFAAVSAVIAAGLAIVFIWSLGGSRKLAEERSPDGDYRVELFTSTRLQSVLHPSMDEPGFVELYNNRSGKLVATGPVVDFFGGANGQVLWLNKNWGQVAVGRDTLFSNVPPLNPDGEPMPIERLPTK